MSNELARWFSGLLLVGIGFWIGRRQRREDRQRDFDDGYDAGYMQGNVKLSENERREVYRWMRADRIARRDAAGATPSTPEQLLKEAGLRGEIEG